MSCWLVFKIWVECEVVPSDVVPSILPFNGHSEPHDGELNICKTSYFFLLPDEREKAKIIVIDQRQNQGDSKCAR